MQFAICNLQFAICNLIETYFLMGNFHKYILANKATLFLACFYILSIGPVYAYEVGHNANLSFSLASWKTVKEKCKDKFEGIGATLFGGGRQEIIVANLLPNSPALQSSLRRGDIILRVDGYATKNKSLMDVVRRIRGPRNTVVTLFVQRWDKKRKKKLSLSIKIVRGVIKLDCPKK